MSKPRPNTIDWSAVLAEAQKTCWKAELCYDRYPHEEGDIPTGILCFPFRTEEETVVTVHYSGAAIIQYWGSEDFKSVDTKVKGFSRGITTTQQAIDAFHAAVRQHRECNRSFYQEMVEPVLAISESVEEAISSTDSNVFGSNVQEWKQEMGIDAAALQEQLQPKMPKRSKEYYRRKEDEEAERELIQEIFQRYEKPR